MSDPVLAAIGRSHRAQDIRRAYALARETGVGAVNMDLIAGLPADTPAGFRRTVEEVLAMAPENITVHTLALKRGPACVRRETPLPSGTECGRHAGLRLGGPAPGRLSALLLVPAEIHVGVALKTWAGANLASSMSITSV